MITFSALHPLNAKGSVMVLVTSHRFPSHFNYLIVNRRFDKFIVLTRGQRITAARSQHLTEGTLKLNYMFISP